MLSRFFIFVCLFIVMLSDLCAYAQKISTIIVRGTMKVETRAIKTILASKEGSEFDRDKVAEDIKAIYNLGFFSDVRVYMSENALIFDLVEKPSIVDIQFQGLSEISKDDFEDKLSTKLYTILNDSQITDDIRMIEKTYAEKGFYLAKVTYETVELNKNETVVVFTVEENGKVLVGDVFIHGNKYFSDSDLAENMVTRATTRSSVIGSSSLYQDAFVARDAEFLAFYYKDFGFAEVKVGTPIVELGVDRNYVEVSFQLEEGLQYWMGEVSFSGDLLYSKEELSESLELKNGDLFKFSKFRSDIDRLIDMYGDLGYAYVDVNPKTTFDKKNQRVNVNFVFTKGPKVYFGLMNVVGNTKTRDNVVRREMEIGDGDLYSRIGLRESKRGIEQLGFFESVQILQERDENDENKLNLNIKVKEKPTGQLQAAIGFNPGSENSSWFGQGTYKEENQSGKGWKTSITGKTDGDDNNSLDLSFRDPRVNDSYWSLGLGLGYSTSFDNSLGIDTVRTSKSANVTVGRKIIELIRGSVGVYFQNTTQDAGDQYLRDRFRLEGDLIGLRLALSRKDLDNFLDPTDGSSVVASHRIFGGFMGGDYEYMESDLTTTYYYPIFFSDTYKTNFKFNLSLSKLYSLNDKPIPFVRRYRLGGVNDLRGYNTNSITPKFAYLSTPFEDILGARSRVIQKGGDRQFLFQTEYFMPLIPQAGIKTVFFVDTGRVYDNGEDFELSDFSTNVGFGIRWITPIAPFRFEWAFPVDENGDLGSSRFIFNLGY